MWSDRRGRLFGWHAETGAWSADGSVRLAAVSPDGRFVAVADGHGVELLDPRDGAPIRVPVGMYAASPGSSSR